MFQLIEQVFIVADETSANELVEKLSALNIHGRLVDRAEVSADYHDPLIIGGSNDRSAHDLIGSITLKSDSAVLIWSHEHPNRASLCVTEADKRDHSNEHLEFDEAVYALIQSYLQKKRPISSDAIFLSGNMVGRSSTFKKTLALTKKIADIDCDVLIRGETGTGKELIARFIHYQSARQDQPFVPINCGAFNDDLLLSELFGHTKGAFTGADSDRIGLIEQAQNGTLFLDEIDSLSSKAQVALLRYLQDREVRPQGGNTLRTCDARVLAASNKSLNELVAKGQFREDLLFRLDVLHIDLPPLRKRGDDIHLLTQYFIHEAAKKYNQPTKVFSPNMVQTLAHYEWPGNIRQLQNKDYRLYLLSDQFMIRIDFASKLAGVNWRRYLDCEKFSNKLTGMQNEKQRVIASFEQSYIRDVLSKTSGNISKAAKLANKERSSFIRLMKKHKIKRSDFVSDF